MDPKPIEEFHNHTCEMTQSLPLLTPVYTNQLTEFPEPRDGRYLVQEPQIVGHQSVSGQDLESTLIPVLTECGIERVPLEQTHVPHFDHPATSETQPIYASQPTNRSATYRYPVPLLSKYSKFYNQTTYELRMPFHPQTSCATFEPREETVQYQPSCGRQPATFQNVSCEMAQGNRSSAYYNKNDPDTYQTRYSQYEVAQNSTFQSYKPLETNNYFHPEYATLQPSYKPPTNQHLEQYHPYFPTNGIATPQGGRVPLVPQIPPEMILKRIPPFSPFSNNYCTSSIVENPQYYNRNIIVSPRPMLSHFVPPSQIQPLYRHVIRDERISTGSQLPEPILRTQSGTQRATSRLSFPEHDINRLSPGFSKTVMAHPRNNATFDPNGFRFPCPQLTYGTGTNSYDVTKGVADTVPLPQKPTTAPQPIPTLFRNNTPGEILVPSQIVPFENPFEPESIPPPLPPRATPSKVVERRPPPFNPIFGTPEVRNICTLPSNPPPYNPRYQLGGMECFSSVPLLSKCSYCEEEFESGLLELHIKEECPLNPEGVNTSDTLIDTSILTEKLLCVTCNNEFDSDTIATHLEICQPCVTSLDTMTSSSIEPEGPVTMTTVSEIESLEVEEEICRRCEKKFTMTGLKQHADECFRKFNKSDTDVEIMDIQLASLPPCQEPASLPNYEALRSDPVPSPFVFRAGPEEPGLQEIWPLSPRLTDKDLESIDLSAPSPLPPLIRDLPLFPKVDDVESDEEMDDCPVCKEEFRVEDLPGHFEECRDQEEGTCPNCKKSFLITILPDHTEWCHSDKSTPIIYPVPKTRSVPKSYPVQCSLDVTRVGQGLHRENVCGVCFLEVNPKEMESHRIQCLRCQQSEYTELNRKNWIRCLSCLKDITPEDFNEHIKTCDDMLLGDISRYKKFTPKLEDIDWATAALTKEQREAMDYVVKNAKKLSDKSTRGLSDRIVRLGFAKCDLERTLEWVNFEAPVIIHVFVDKLLPLLLKDDYYKNQFETGTSHGSRDLIARSRWEDNIFNNIYHNVKGADRVKYGVLNIVGDIYGVKSCKQYGDSYFILKRVRLRTSFASADSSNSTVKIASCEHYAHVLNEYTDAELSAILNVGSKKKPYANSDVIQQYKEVQIHGPIELSEHIECVVVNPRHKGDEKVKELLQNFIIKNKCNMIWMED